MDNKKTTVTTATTVTVTSTIAQKERKPMNKNTDKVRAEELRNLVAAEFLAEYGTGNEWDEEEDDLWTGGDPEGGDNYEDLAKELSDVYISDAVEHFLTVCCRNLEEEGRYFYNNDELIDFEDRFVRSGGNLNDLHVGRVYDSPTGFCRANDPKAEFMCYEVCREKYYRQECAHPQKKNVHGALHGVFFS